MLKECIKKLLSGLDLSLEEASQAMDTIMVGEATPAQIAGLLVALKQKGESAAEVAGFVRAMRKHAVKVNLANDHAIDGCGTGGDGAHTFNISTAAALVASAVGLTVAKHGNRSVSSKCGSADILEACGGDIDPGPGTVEKNINDIGFGFMFAPRFHPAMKHAAGPRRELGVRTVFNILGPMCNPALVKRQVMGVYSKDLISLVAEVMEMSGCEHAIVAHSRDGLDEFAVGAPTDYVEIRGDRRVAKTIEPEHVGLARHGTDSLRGGDADFNRRILKDVLEGGRNPYRDAVVLNAGVMVYVGGEAESIAGGVRLAQEVLDNGAARQRLDDWVRASKAPR